MMTQHDPPAALHLNVQTSDKFDSSMYKAYTRTGDTIDYVVWPAMLLYEEGPVLAKGIVQCLQSFQDCKSAPSTPLVDTSSNVHPGSQVLTDNTQLPYDQSNGNSKYGMTTDLSDQSNHSLNTSEWKLRNPSASTAANVNTSPNVANVSVTSGYGLNPDLVGTRLGEEQQPGIYIENTPTQQEDGPTRSKVDLPEAYEQLQQNQMETSLSTHTLDP